MTDGDRGGVSVVTPPLTTRHVEAVLVAAVAADLIVSRVAVGTGAIAEANPATAAIVAESGWWVAAVVGLASTGLAIGVFRLARSWGYSTTSRAGLLTLTGLKVAVVAANVATLAAVGMIPAAFLAYAGFVGALAAIVLVLLAEPTLRLRAAIRTTITTATIRRMGIVLCALMVVLAAGIVAADQAFLEGFEDGDTAEWTKSGSADMEAQTDVVFNGTYSGNTTGGGGGDDLIYTFTNNSYNNFSIAVNWPDPTDDGNDPFIQPSDGGPEYGSFLTNNSGGFEWYDGNFHQLHAFAEADQWYVLSFENIDYQNNQVDIVLQYPNGTEVFNHTDMGLKNAATGLDRVKIRDYDPHIYIDDLKVDSIPVKTEFTASGSVADDAGNDLDGVTVTIENQTTGSTVDTTTTDSNGDWSVSLNDGDYTATTDPDGYASDSEDFTVSGADVTGIDLVVSDSGDPLANEVTPRNDAYIDKRNVSLQARLSDPDDDPIDYEIEWFNRSTQSYEVVDSGTVSSPTTVTHTQPSLPADNKWRINLSDGVNEVTYGPWDYDTPGRAYIYNGSCFCSTVNRTMNVTYASTESDYQDDRRPDDGTAEYTGVPQEEFRVTISDPWDLFRNTTIVVDHPRQINFALLQPKSGEQLENDGNDSTGEEDTLPGGNATHDVTFTLDDQTGAFPPSETVLTVEEFYNGSWRTLGSDSFGSTNSAGPFGLRNGTEYRLEIENEDGDSCSLGSFEYQYSLYQNGPIKLRVSDRCVDDDEVDGSNEPPIARMHVGGAGDGIATNETLTFDATNSTDPDGQVVKSEWDFGDGNNDSGSIVTHSYHTGGNYSIELTVTDDDGATDTITKDVFVANLTEPPIARIWMNDTAVDVDDTVMWSGNRSSDPDGTIDAFAWDFADKTGDPDSTNETVNITHDQAGTFQEELEVTDNSGETDTTFVTINTSATGDDLPVANFTWDPFNPDAGEETTLNATTSTDDGTIDLFQWDVDGDGHFEVEGETVTTVFDTNGTYDVTLRVHDDVNQFNETTHTITVGAGEPGLGLNAPPNATFTVSPENPDAGREVTLNASNSSDPEGATLTFAWDLDNDGDYDDANGEIVTTAFDADGEYQVSLKVTDNLSQTDTRTKLVTVGDGDPINKGYEWSAEWVDENESDDQAAILFTFQSANDTDVVDFNVSFFPVGNFSAGVNYELGTIQSWSHKEILTGDQLNQTPWKVHWMAVIDGEEREGSIIVGPSSLDCLICLDLDEQWRNIFAIGFLIFIAGLFGGRNAELGAIVVALLGGMLWVVGWFDGIITGGVVVFAIIVAALWRIGSSPATDSGVR